MVTLFDNLTIVSTESIGMGPARSDECWYSKACIRLRFDNNSPSSSLL